MIRPSLLTLSLLIPGLGFAAENPQVAALAREGHWLDTGWAAHGPMLGRPAPGLSLSGWLNGEVSPSAMKGKIVVVDFWATWCGPCRASVPHNNEIAKKFTGSGVLVIGACGSGRGEEKMEEVAKATGLAYPTARVASASTAAWNVQWWPAPARRPGTSSGGPLTPSSTAMAPCAPWVSGPTTWRRSSKPCWWSSPSDAVV